MKIYHTALKPILDLIGAIILLVILFPFFLIICMLLGWQNKGDIFFLQDRPGKLGKTFKIIKFKTMRDAFDASGDPLPDEIRITSIGRFIRMLSLDEILQIINVIKGDMSLVGPRPLLIEYLPLYNEVQMRRHLVRPGITGWAQVNGRNALEWNQKFFYDVWYVDNISFTLDCKILLLTVLKVFKRQGINQDGSASAVKFNGNN